MGHVSLPQLLELGIQSRTPLQDCLPNIGLQLHVDLVVNGLRLLRISSFSPRRSQHIGEHFCSRAPFRESVLIEHELVTLSDFPTSIGVSYDRVLEQTNMLIEICVVIFDLRHKPVYLESGNSLDLITPVNSPFIFTILILRVSGVVHLLHYGRQAILESVCDSSHNVHHVTGRHSRLLYLRRRISKTDCLRSLIRWIWSWIWPPLRLLRWRFKHNSGRLLHDHWWRGSLPERRCKVPVILQRPPGQASQRIHVLLEIIKIRKPLRFKIDHPLHSKLLHTLVSSLQWVRCHPLSIEVTIFLQAKFHTGDKLEAFQGGSGQLLDLLR